MITRVDVVTTERGPASSGVQGEQHDPFDPLVAAAVEVRAQRQVANDIAIANRRAGLDQRLLEQDLRVLDAEVRSRDDLRAVDVALAEVGLGPADGLFRTAAPAASPMAPARAAARGQTPQAVRHEPAQDTPTTPADQHKTGPTTPQVGEATAERALPGNRRPGVVAPPAITARSTPPPPAGAAGFRQAVAGPAAVGTGAAYTQGQGGRAGGGPSHNSVADAQALRGPRPERAGPTFTMKRTDLPQAAERRTMDGVLKILQSKHAEGRSVVKLRLTPPELGTLTVDIKMQRQGMTLRFETQSEAVRDLIQHHAGDLADALREQGVRLEQLDINVRPHDSTAEGSTTADGGSSGTDPSSSRGQDARGDAEVDEEEVLETALAEAVEEGLMAAGRVDIRA